MSDGLNKVMLLGNLGADPELRSTSGGQSILKLRLATAESYLDRDKNRQERTEWHSITVWGKRGEALAKFLEKGSRIFVEGKIRTSSYDDKEGQKRYRTEIIADEIILCGGKRGGGAGQSAPAQAAQTAGGDYDDADYGDPAPDASGVRNDDFPF
jgi:single-strand DNA-binding protein